MDQVKTGKFIAELRKEKELSQKQLADMLGISDKTVSRWETGKGLPEASLMIPLCGLLGITVNDMLSGERVSEADYSRKAEENIMKLYENSRSEKGILSGIVMVVIGALLISVYILLYFTHNYQGGMLPSFYPETIILEFGAAIAFLAASGLLGSFFRALPLAFLNKDAERAELCKAETALSLFSKTVLFTEILMFLLELTNLNAAILAEVVSMTDIIEHGTQLGFDYVIVGIVVYLLFLPVRARLKVKISKCE